MERLEEGKPTTEALRHGTHCREIPHYLHTHTFVHKRNEALPSPSQLKLFFISRPRRDGRLSWLRRKTAVSKQSAQDRYVVDIAVVSGSNRHALLMTKTAIFLLSI